MYETILCIIAAVAGASVFWGWILVGNINKNYPATTKNFLVNLIIDSIPRIVFAMAAIIILILLFTWDRNWSFDGFVINDFAAGLYIVSIFVAWGMKVLMNVVYETYSEIQKEYEVIIAKCEKERPGFRNDRRLKRKVYQKIRGYFILYLRQFFGIDRIVFDSDRRYYDAKWEAIFATLKEGMDK